MLKDKFVCVALDARRERGVYKDADGDFVRAANCVTVTASGSVSVVTVLGKTFGPYNSPGVGMEKWLHSQLKSFELLPEAERSPGVLKNSQPADRDPQRHALELPADTMVLRVFNRHLGWNTDKSLRMVQAEDYATKASAAELERYGMAQNDFMWVPKNEWRGLVPTEPRVGASHPVPTSFALRLYRFHLDPCRGFTEGAAFTTTKANAGSLQFRVTSVNEDRIGLRLVGQVKLQQSGREGPAVFEPELLGELEFDRRQQRFTRFDLLAIGTAKGLPTDANGVVTPRKGPYPLGIAFELVPNPTGAERLHPRGLRDSPATYWSPKE